MPRVILPVWIGLSLLAGLTGYTRASAEQRQGEGQWVPVEVQTLQRFTPAVGSLRANQKTRLGTQVTSRVEKVLVDVGDVVKRSQPLLQLDRVAFEISLGQRKAALEVARVGAADAKLNLESAKDLFERQNGQPAISRRQFDEANAHSDAAVARVTEAEAGVRAAQNQLDETVIRAPFNAVVTQRFVDPGETVTAVPVTPVLEVQEIEVLQLEFSLPQEMLARVRKGTPVTFEVAGAAGARGTGSVSIVHPAIDEATRSFRSRVMVDNRDFRYRPGQLAQVRVLDQEVPNVLVLPRAALQQTATGWRVQVEQDGKPVPKTVKVGLSSDEAVEIREGLAAGQKVWVPTRR